VASVVVMLAVGEGSKRQVMAQMGAFGSNILYLSGSAPNPRTPPGIITLDDVAALASLPQVSASCRSTAPKPACVRQRRPLSYVGGNDTNFPAIFNWPVVEGSYFTEADERTLQPSR
jgi:macrolide transport system ATP-binding/permease protein